MLDQQQLTYLGPLEPFTFTIDEQVQGRYLEALQDYHLRYVADRCPVGPVVHPGVLLNHSNATRSPSFGGPNTGWIHTRDETRFTNPARLHDELTANWWVEGHEPRFGRVVTRVSCVVTGRGGEEILRRTSWGLRSSQQRPIRHRTALVDRDPGELSTLVKKQTSLAASGREIPGKHKIVTADRINLFSGWLTRNIHTDDEVAKTAGLVAPVASATQGMGFICEFMIDNFGVEWLAGGRCALTFRKPVLAGDRLATVGVLADVAAADDAWCEVAIRLVNQRGVPVTDGTAVAWWPSRT